MCLASRAAALMIALACGVMSAGGGTVPAPLLQPLPAAAAPPAAAASRASFPSPSSQQAPIATGSLSGTVVSRVDRAPLGRARIVLTSPALSEARVAISAGNGTYQFQHLPAASYSLSVTRSGYVSQEYGQRRSAPATPVPLGAGQALGGIDFALEPAGVIAGRLLDEDKNPFAGAIVRALLSRTENGQPTLVTMASAQTDDRGDFRLTGLAGGQYYVSAFDPAFENVGDETGPLRYTPTYYPGVAFAQQATRVGVTPGVEPTLRITFSLRIIRPARVSGLLISEDRRQLVSGALIMTPLHGEGLTAIPTQDVTILPDGSFAFRNVPPGAYQIRARGTTDPGTSFFATFNVIVEGRDISHADLVLLPGASVTGKVGVDAVRIPRLATFAGVRVRAPFIDGNSFGDALTGDVQPDGSYALRGLMSGLHVITMQGLPYPWVLKSVSHRGQDITDAGLEAESRQQFEDVRVTVTDVASEVSGTVRNSGGAAVVDATVLIIPLAQQFWTPTSRRIGLLRTDAAGRYRIRGLAAGEYRAVASLELDESDAYRPGLLRDVSDAGAALTLGSLESRVLDLPLVSMAALRRTSAR